MCVGEVPVWPALRHSLLQYIGPAGTGLARPAPSFRSCSLMADDDDARPPAGVRGLLPGQLLQVVVSEPSRCERSRSTGLQEARALRGATNMCRGF